MTLNIALSINNAIILGTDCQRTMTNRFKDGSTNVSYLGNTQKTFITFNNVGISTNGDADIEVNEKNIYLGKYINYFINTIIGKRELSVREVSDELVHYFSSFEQIPNTEFYVAGYDYINNKYKKQLYQVCLKKQDPVIACDAANIGASFSGITDIVNNLFSRDCYNENKNFIDIIKIDFANMSIKDGIDFVRFCIKVTSDIMKFQDRNPVVGSGHDILVLTEKNHLWETTRNLVNKKYSIKNFQNDRK